MPQSFPFISTDRATLNLRVTQENDEFSKDGRPWQTWCTSKRSQHGEVRRRAWCSGSWKCPNLKCLFLNEKGSCNDVQFTERQNSMCFVCKEDALTFDTCTTVKIWEFSAEKNRSRHLSFWVSHLPSNS